MITNTTSKPVNTRRWFVTPRKTTTTTRVIQLPVTSKVPLSIDGILKASLIGVWMPLTKVFEPYVDALPNGDSGRRATMRQSR